MVSTLSLDGMDKWSLDPRFKVEIVSGETNFEPHNVPECQEVTLVVFVAPLFPPRSAKQRCLQA
jgi:hypothetical protein